MSAFLRFSFGFSYHEKTNIAKFVTEKMNTLILINLQRRKHTYLYSSVKGKKETKLESN